MSVAAPSLALLGLEPIRALCEWALTKASSDAPRCAAGNRHPVVVFPGLAMDHRATQPLRSHLQRHGFVAYDWGLGVNTGPKGDLDEWLEPLRQRIEELHDEHEEPVSLVGWSLGGIYARELARHRPRHVRRVVTLGTPFAGPPQHTHAQWLYRLLNGQGPHVPPRLSQRLRQPPPVPTTSVYSRTDGVVAWEHCVQKGRPRTKARIRNVELNEASHFGMVLHPKALSTVVQVLLED